MKKVVTSFIEERQTVIKGPNEELFYTLLQRFRPDLFVLADLIDKNNINYYVIFKILRQLINVGQGSHWGRVVINIQDNKVRNIDGIDSDKVEENIFIA